AAQPAYYTSMTQNPIGRATAVVELSRPDVGGVERAIRAEIKKFDPSMALDFTDASAMVRATLSRQELGMTLMLLFGIMAVVLAAVGIYGVVSYTGSLRRGEMATRLALGASPRSVFLLVLRQGATLGLIGAGVGIALAYASGRLVSSRVYAIQASDPVILSIATVLIASITILATAIPALRAARLSPADSLQA
ncbi:MAG TPA: FtsX-like permease family protein, partial [Gemmatimonadaceae bacterium]|nr:FtsX-like permease family protein [Gemmatimonadaceae bacterium]